MLEQYLRPVFQTYFVDASIKQSKIVRKLNPNTCTLLGMLVGLASMFAIGLEYNILAILLVLFSGFLDVFDGSLARFQGNSTQLGTVYDIFSDRVVESAIILGLFWVAPDERGWLCLLMLSATLCCVTSFLVVGIFSDNNTSKSFYYSPGLIERFEAFVFFIAMILLPDKFLFLATAYILLVSVTAFIRIWEFSKQSKLKR